MGDDLPRSIVKSALVAAVGEGISGSSFRTLKASQH